MHDRATCLEIPEGQCVPLATPGRGWSLLLGSAPARGAEHIADILWLGLLFMPIGYWLRPRRDAALGLAIGSAGLLGASLLSGSMTGIDWLVTGLGPVLGLSGGVWAGRTLAPDLSEVRWRAR